MLLVGHVLLSVASVCLYNKITLDCPQIGTGIITMQLEHNNNYMKFEDEDHQLNFKGHGA